jgi:hypothetical protein
MICVWPPPIQDVGQRAGSEMAFGGTVEILLLLPVVANDQMSINRFHEVSTWIHKVS